MTGSVTTGPGVRRVLLAGWSSFVHGEATAGDLQSMEVVARWLGDASVDHDVALSPAFPTGVDIEAVDPAAYTDVVFICGPAHGWQVRWLTERFTGCTLHAVGVSVIDGADGVDGIAGFTHVLARDGGEVARPDLSLASPLRTVPLAAVVRAHAQPEYGDDGHDRAHAAFDRLLAGRDIAVDELDTRVDPRQTGITTSAAIETRLARADVVLSTRLHGMVLALKHGVPAVAVDPIPGGAKVSRQAAALGWPHCHRVDQLNDAALAASFAACLEPPAAQQARACRDRARADLDDLARRFTGTLLGHAAPTR